MLVIPGGQERMEKVYRHLFGQAGFRLSRTNPTPTEVRVIEGVPEWESRICYARCVGRRVDRDDPGQFLVNDQEGCAALWGKYHTQIVMCAVPWRSLSD